MVGSAQLMHIAAQYTCDFFTYKTPVIWKKYKPLIWLNASLFFKRKYTKSWGVEKKRIINSFTHLVFKL